MTSSWILTSLETALLAVICVFAVHLAVILSTRVAGLRSLSKISSFDFVMTVAIGSLVATAVLTSDPPLLRAGVALVAIYLSQMVVARLRVGSRWFAGLVDNRPRLLMWEGEVLSEGLRACKLTEGDLRAKLREANVLQLEEVRAAVMETTGDVSVLHSRDPDAEVEPWLIQEVEILSSGQAS